MCHPPRPMDGGGVSKLLYCRQQAIIECVFFYSRGHTPASAVLGQGGLQSCGAGLAADRLSPGPSKQREVCGTLKAASRNRKDAFRHRLL